LPSIPTKKVPDAVPVVNENDLLPRGPKQIQLNDTERTAWPPPTDTESIVAKIVIVDEIYLERSPATRQLRESVEFEAGRDDEMVPEKYTAAEDKGYLINVSDNKLTC